MELAGSIENCGKNGSRISMSGQKIIEDELFNGKQRSEVVLNPQSFNEVSISSDAVLVIKGNKSFGIGKHCTPILKNFNMTVKKGTIYSLLGSSGCGKTTLLSSVVGLKKLDSGKILLSGYAPGQRGSGVPGKRVGYMPQEIALVGEFSIEETLRYFGSLYGIGPSVLKRNSEFLIDFLKLPPPERRVNTLSGGQQRRVSFAVALVHNPELLILDEPTVGVDPLLRKSIWSHLTSLTSTGKTTVIITTHYIEEARESHTVGLMRNGRLLAEDSPESLLKQYDTDLLEDIVLRLCLKDNSQINEENKDWILENNEITFTSSGTTKRVDDENENDKKTNRNVVGLRYRQRNPDLWDPESIRKWNDYQRNSLPNIYDEISTHYYATSKMKDSFHRIISLCSKNTLTMTRNLIFLLFLLLLPAIQIILICAAIGSDINGLGFGIVNKDFHSMNEVFHNYSFSDFDFNDHGCIFHENYTGSASIHYLSLISNSSFVYLVNYETEEEAMQDVLRTKLYGYMYFPENFTDYMKERLMFGVNSELDAVFGSQISFHLDLSKKQIGEEMKQKFYKWFYTFLDNSATACNIENHRMKTPIFFTKPVYGSEETNFTEFIAPSLLIGILFFFPLVASGVTYIKEEKSGLLARSQVAGVTKMEIMVAYSITNFILLLVQTGLAFMCMMLAFGVQIQGSLILAVIMALTVGVAGVSVGFLYTTFCTEEVQVVLLAQGTFFPNFIVTGMIWPAIGMPKFLQYFSFVLPCTLACESIRCIVSRGVGFYHIGVWPGFLSTILWILLYWAITIFISTRKK